MSAQAQRPSLPQDTGRISMSYSYILRRLGDCPVCMFRIKLKKKVKSLGTEHGMVSIFT